MIAMPIFILIILAFFSLVNFAVYFGLIYKNKGNIMSLIGGLVAAISFIINLVLFILIANGA